MFARQRRLFHRRAGMAGGTAHLDLKLAED
jgi:hypothetical protein